MGTVVPDRKTDSAARHGFRNFPRKSYVRPPSVTVVPMPIAALGTLRKEISPGDCTVSR